MNNSKNAEFLKQFDTGKANPRKIEPLPPSFVSVITKDANGKVTGISAAADQEKK